MKSKMLGNLYTDSLWKTGRPKNTWRRTLTSEARNIVKTSGEIKKQSINRENGKLQWSPYVSLGTKWIKF